jgi:hypothetical protein
MLDRLVVVDYVDGAGGEYISTILNQHEEFNSGTVTEETQKWLNSRRQLNAKNWDSVFESECQLFVDRCAKENITDIAIPYHCYLYPKHIDVLKKYAKDTRFVNIDMGQHYNMVIMEYARKVLFRPLTKANFNEIKYRIRDPKADDSKELVNLMMQNKLFAIDLILYRDGLRITKENRQTRISYLLDRRRSSPSDDIILDYGNTFVLLDNLEKSYYTLCNSLNIQPNTEILDSMYNRNTINLAEATEFTENFDSIQDHVLSTTP